MRLNKQARGPSPALSLAIVMAVALALAMITTACQAEDDRPATFEYIQTTILAPNCATIGCHSQYGEVANYYFDGDATEVCQDVVVGLGLVSAGMPDTSFMISAIRGETGEALQMPPDRALPEADIELIQRWIAEGASCD